MARITHESIQLKGIERWLVNFLRSDLNVSPNLYADLAKELESGEAEVISSIESLFTKGLIRCFGAVIARQKSGFAANAMVILFLDEKKLDLVGGALANLPYVSHCYRHNPTPDWPFNLYAMFHADNQVKLAEMAQKIAKKSETTNWKVLKSQRILKRIFKLNYLI
ncbi:MAG: Lrp/AsnC family transcriptional regulator [Deltaproteobacteria bacterium]|jgi:DNA-binding Lrp family transcriptional regulator|nr:Lrp/AsnC family transcriptional regulator [Deltaproteobacteria bacterium]